MKRRAGSLGLIFLSVPYPKALPKLEIIGCFGTPRGTVDLALARRCGVVVTNAGRSWTSRR